jgi:AcrR family transcriptional regulator
MAADTRERILDAAAELLVSAGTDGVSTRAVAAAAGVQAPTLYRLFGDKQGLLEAVVAHGFERYLADKHAMAATADPIEDLRRGWDLHVEFGLRHPAFYTLMFGNPRPGHQPPAAADASRVLLTMLRRAAQAGILRLPVKAAAEMAHAAGVGVTLTLIAAGTSPDAQPALSTQVREAIFAALFTASEPAADRSLAASAIALDAALTASDDATGDGVREACLTSAETALLHQWLTRLSTP